MVIFLGALFILVCILLIVVVLLQKGRGGGLGAAFGGAGTAAFGTRTGDVFTWVTIVLTGLFLLLAIGTVLYMRPATPTLPTPIIQPRSQEISEAMQVGIGFTSQQEKDVKIYYTLDGTEPRENAAGSNAYDKPFEVLPNTTVKARAFSDGGRAKPSGIATAVYGFKPVPTSQPEDALGAPASRQATSRQATSRQATSRQAAPSGASTLPATMNGRPAAGREAKTPATVGG